MSDTRYRWSARTWQENCFELKNRARANPECRRTLDRDSHLHCLVRSCGKSPRRGDQVYYPSPNANTLNNKIIGHVECVDRFVSEHTAASATEARMREVQAKGLLPLAAASAASMKAKEGNNVSKKSAQNSKRPSEPAFDAASVIERMKLRHQVWLEGFEAGFQAALAELEKR